MGFNKNLEQKNNNHVRVLPRLAYSVQLIYSLSDRTRIPLFTECRMLLKSDLSSRQTNEKSLLLVRVPWYRDTALRRKLIYLRDKKLIQQERRP